MMHAIIYSFKVKEGHNDLFEQVWEDLTQQFIKHAGGSGSRLHKRDEQEYVAYAQWESEDSIVNAWNLMPNEAKELSDKMKSYCEKIETLFELEVVKDLLIK